MKQSLLVQLAAKNMLRNIRRTILSGTTIFITAAVLCMLFAFENAMIVDMKNNIKNHVTGDIRIRDVRYSQNERIHPVQFYTGYTQQIADAVRQIPGIVSVEPQISTGVSVYTDGQMNTARAVGVDFETSRFFTGKNNILLEGAFPRPEQSTQGSAESDSGASSGTLANKRPVRYAVISEGFARKFGFTVGDKFTFLVQTATRGTNGPTVTVSGIVHIDDTDFNGNTFFMDWQTLSEVMRMRGNALELLVHTQEKTGSGATVLTSIREAVRQAGGEFEYEVLPWTEVSLLYQAFRLVDIVYAVIGIIFFALAATVIFNTTMMSVLERKKEIGTLMSLGMQGTTITHLFLLETACISCISSLAGTLIGALAVALTHRTGFDMNAFGAGAISGMGFSSWLYPQLEFGRYAMIFLLGSITATAACIIPARMALSVQPAQVLRSEN